ncbi:NADPH-dependent FMN reductase [Kineococcus aurantiacus]|uniref:FMN reductase n=1 Tax=Kineococcus aurantiacus TaxID=37633 RepID=A0A7Y9J145_9ACTN|nr:NAD(P)H-dependent oxidoreductase [Kineococcus aurantiacus]NYD22703.1 FMN reductase [Kineococcus aurantiacus]
MRTVVVCGNPKPASRTLTAAVAAAGLLAADGPAPAGVDQVVDVTTLGPGLLGWGDPGVRQAVADVAAADLLVVASPTFKATYTGLLKLFLDQFAGGEGLRGVVAVPLMLGAGPAHALAPDLLLKPVLAELGAACPAPGLSLLDREAEEHGAGTPALAAYAERWGPTLRATAAAGRAREGSLTP